MARAPETSIDFMCVGISYVGISYHLSIYLPLYLPIHLSIIYLPVYRDRYLFFRYYISTDISNIYKYQIYVSIDIGTCSWVCFYRKH